MQGLPNYIVQNEPEDRKEDHIDSAGPTEMTRDDMDGKDAFFALMGIKMMRLSVKYSKPI